MKYKSKRIGSMTAIELKLHCSGLAAKICVITGWQIPESFEYVNVLEEQLKKLLVDEYMHINIDEFEYAMRTHGTIIKDWGKTMNLSLIREALDIYISQRTDLSRIEEAAQVGKPKKENEFTDDWSYEWGILKRGNIEPVYLNLIPWSAIYDWLEKTGQLTLTIEEKKLIMYGVRESEIGRIGLLKEACRATPDDKANLERLKCKNWYNDSTARGLLITDSKRIAVQQLLTKISTDENTSSL